MPSIVSESFSLHNLPVTLVFCGVLLYWLLVILGLAGDDDAAGGDADVDAADSGDSGGSGGMWVAAGRYFGFGQVPLMVLVSFLAVFMWTFSVLANYYFNGEPGARSAGTALLLLVPNLVVSLVLTRIATLPFVKFFAAMNDSTSEAEAVAGRLGRVVSAQVDERYGQVEIRGSGAPVLVNARTPAGAVPIARGTIVRLHPGPDAATFHLVEPAPDVPPGTEPLPPTTQPSQPTS